MTFSTERLSTLAPRGHTRASINTGNPILARLQADGSPAGVSVDLARRFAQHLTRAANAQILRAPTSPAVVDTFVQSNAQVAGVRQQLEADAQRIPGLRLLPSFRVIQQAMGIPKPRGEAAQRVLAAFVEDAKASGFVAQALERHGIRGATIAPRADA